MTQLEEAKKAVEQICLRQNVCWHDTKTIATAVYVILIHMIDADRKADRKTEPTSSKMEQVDEPYIDIETGILHWCGWKYRRIYEDEPQTERSSE